MTKRKKKLGKELNSKEFEKLKRAYKKLLNQLSDVFKRRNKKFPTIFISHNVPYDTKLDIIKDLYAVHLGRLDIIHDQILTLVIIILIVVETLIAFLK